MTRASTSPKQAAPGTRSPSPDGEVQRALLERAARRTCLREALPRAILANSKWRMFL